DRWLNVRISVHATKDPASAQLFTVDGLTTLISGTGNANWDGKSVADLMRTGQINPGQLEAVREIISDGALATDTDVAVFHGSRADFTLTRNANGTVTVVDTVVAPVLGADGIKIPLIDDEGTDTLVNIEVARFTNFDANGIPTGTFTDVSLARASGAPTITSTGTNVLTASTAGIVDANGIANTIRYQWQTSATGTGPWTNA
ncbi:hypothetical protein AB4Z40_35730, partial [Bosea sp. 2YAB26]|uniref:hypothetical protein n=1 Tax=Bosea sp. 2YAB26 TaxID=3237478 RepID=UPI003F90E94B